MGYSYKFKRIRRGPKPKMYKHNGWSSTRRSMGGLVGRINKRTSATKDLMRRLGY